MLHAIAFFTNDAFDVWKYLLFLFVEIQDVWQLERIYHLCVLRRLNISEFIGSWVETTAHASFSAFSQSTTRPRRLRNSRLWPLGCLVSYVIIYDNNLNWILHIYLSLESYSGIRESSLSPESIAFYKSFIRFLLPSSNFQWKTRFPCLKTPCFSAQMRSYWLQTPLCYPPSLHISLAYYCTALWVPICMFGDYFLTSALSSSSVPINLAISSSSDFLSFI